MKRVLALAAVLAVAACSPKSVVIPSDPQHWGDIAHQVKQLSPEDRRLFTAYIAREALAGGLSGGKPNIPQGTTIGKAIDDHRKFETDASAAQAQEAIDSAKAAAALAAKEAALNNSVAVTVTSKTYLASDPEAGRYSDRVNFVIVVHNKTSKGHRRGKGNA